MTHRPHTRLLTSLLVGAALALQVAACSSDDSSDPTGPGVDLSGTYALLSFTFEGQTTLVPPDAIGTLVLTATRYTVDITIETPIGTQDIHDTGTYSIDGNGWSQTSDDGSIQSVGTFDLTDGVLTVDVTTQGLRVVNVWQRS